MYKLYKTNHFIKALVRSVFSCLFTPFFLCEFKIEKTKHRIKHIIYSKYRTINIVLPTDFDKKSGKNLVKNRMKIRNYYTYHAYKYVFKYIFFLEIRNNIWNVHFDECVLCISVFIQNKKMKNSRFMRSLRFTIKQKWTFKFKRRKKKCLYTVYGLYSFGSSILCESY